MAIPTNAYSFAGARYYVGLSSIIGLTVIPGQIATIFKHGGGGTLWVGGASLAIGATAYLMTTGEALTIDSGGTVFFAASGATCTVYNFLGRSSGFEP